MSGIYKIDGTLVYADREFYEAEAKTALSGKVLISFGDSYTHAMSDKYSATATKYGMVHDGRGVISSTITNRGTAPMCTRVDTIVSDYTNGFTINGTTYHADDVGLICFMGGANDPGGVAAYGEGWNATALDTIYGAMHHIFNTLLSTFTKAKIICIVQPPYFNAKVSDWATDDATAQRFGFDTADQMAALDDVQFSAYMQANKENIVKRCAWLYEVPILDMFHTFPAVFNPSNRATYWQSDKLHLTTAGYNLIANAVDDKIVELFGGG